MSSISSTRGSRFGGTILFILLTILAISVILPAASAQSRVPCEDCHGTSGDYEFIGVSLKAATPRVIIPDSEFEHVVVIKHPGEYVAFDAVVELDISSASELELLEDDAVEFRSLDEGETEIKFKFKANNAHPSQRIRTTLTYTAKYHYDPTEYTEVLDIVIAIDRLILEPSVWTMDVVEGKKGTISFEAREPVTNLVIIPSATLLDRADVDYDSKSSMSKGDTLEFKIKAKSAGRGFLNLIFMDTEGIPHKVTIDVMITPETDTSTSIWVILGAITGITSWIGMVILSLVGTPLKKLKPMANKIFLSARVRKNLHCGLCFTLLGLALLHAIIVMSRHWSGLMVGYTFILADPSIANGLKVNLGTIAWFFMIVVSFQGLFQKQLAKLLNYVIWRWTHIVITVLALGSVTVHAVLLLWLRFFG